MYFWDIKSLASDLKENRLTQKEQLKYYLFFMLAEVVILDLNTDSSFSTPTLNWIAFGLEFIITLLGILWCYKTNRQGDNKDFIIRMICLGLPIGIRILVISIIISTFFFFLFRFKLGETFILYMANISYVVCFMWTRSYLLFISDDKVPSVKNE